VFAGVPLPPSHKLTLAEVFDPRTNKPNHERLKQHFIQEGRIEENAALKVIQDGATLLRTERTMIDIEAPVTGKSSVLSQVCTISYKSCLRHCCTIAFWLFYILSI